MSKKIHKQDYKASKQTMGMHFRWSQLEDSVASVVSQHPTDLPLANDGWVHPDRCCHCERRGEKHIEVLIVSSLSGSMH